MTIPRPWWDSRAFVVAAIVLSALPMLWPSLPPLVDLPGHVGRYHVMADLSRSADLQRHWSYHWAAIGNLGVDLLVWPLAPMIGVEAAAKLVVLLIPPLTVASLIWLSREARGSLSPTAAFAFPLAYAWPLQLGFVNYALAAALALAALAGWIRLGRQRRYGLRAAIFVPVSLALWLAHSFGWAMFGLLALVAEMAQRRGRGEDWLRASLVAGGWCIGLAAPLVLMIAGHASGPGGLAIGWDPVAKLVWITSLLRERWKWYDIASALFLYFTLWAAVRHREYRFDPLLGALALTALALFLVLPRLMMGGAYVDMRILPTAVALGLIAIRPDQAIAHRTALLAVGFFAVRTIGTTVAFLIFAQGQRQAAAAIVHLPRGAAVLVLVDQPCSYEWHSSRTEHVGSLAIARADAFENGEWTLPGQQLLRDRHPAAAPYAADPSQLVYPRDCEAETTDFGSAVRGFDRGTFDHVWTIGFPARARLAPDVRLVWHNDTSALYAVDR